MSPSRPARGPQLEELRGFCAAFDLGGIGRALTQALDARLKLRRMLSAAAIAQT